MQLPAPGYIIALTCLATLLAGLMQFAASFFKVGQLVRFVPYPVIAGFSHGISVILVVVYIPMVLGISAVHPGRSGCKVPTRMVGHDHAHTLPSDRRQPLPLIRSVGLCPP